MILLSLFLSVSAYDLGHHVPMPWVNQPEWQWMILDAFNRRRALHDSPPLMWSVRAANDALRHAKDPRNEHDPPESEFADILARGFKRDPMFYIWQFYDEEEVKIHYDDYKRKDNGPVGHAIQIIWRAYKFIGCAMVHYDPPVNKFRVPYHMTCQLGPKHGELYPGWYPANVVPRKSTWPPGWKPPLKTELNLYNEHYGPPWPGYKYKLRPTPRYSGQGGKGQRYIYKQEFGPTNFDEDARPRYAEVVRKGGGQVPIWDEARNPPRGSMSYNQIMALAHGEQPGSSRPGRQHTEQYHPGHYGRHEPSRQGWGLPSWARQGVPGQHALPSWHQLNQPWNQPHQPRQQPQPQRQPTQSWQEKFAGDFSNDDTIPPELDSSWQTKFSGDIVYDFDDDETPSSIPWQDKFAGDFVPYDESCQDLRFTEDTSGDYLLAMQLQSSMDL